MIRWYDNLYMDDYVKRKEKKVRHAINNGKPVLGIYCIAFASNPANLFDIINVNELLFQHYKRNVIYIVGLAFSKEGAIEILSNMIREMYEDTFAFEVKQYFKFD